MAKTHEKYFSPTTPLFIIFIVSLKKLDNKIFRSQNISLVLFGLLWFIYRYSSGLLHWYWTMVTRAIQ